MLEEYLSSSDAKELISCLKELNAPADFIPDMINWMISNILEKKEREVERLASLFKAIISDGYINSDQFAQGFQKCLEFLPEVIIDIPKADSYVATLLAQGIVSGYLPITFFNRVYELLNKLAPGMGVKIFRILGESKHEFTEKELFDLLTKFLSNEQRDEASFSKFVLDHQLTYLFPTLVLRSQVENMIKAGDNVDSILKWIDHNVPDLQVDESFARWLIRIVLQEAWAYSARAPGDQSEEHLVEENSNRVKLYVPLLHSFLVESIPLQLACLFELQAFMNNIGHPKGVQTGLFVTLYDQDVILEEAFKLWQEDTKDPTLGKDKALFQTHKWLQWLETAEEESGDDEKDEPTVPTSSSS